MPHTVLKGMPASVQSDDKVKVKPAECPSAASGTRCVASVMKRRRGEGIQVVRLVVSCPLHSVTSGSHSPRRTVHVIL